MKVLTSDAVQDPTKVEARVRREVAMRKHQHDKMNAERKLTDEQRREKVENKQQYQAYLDELKPLRDELGMHLLVNFLINLLRYARHSGINVREELYSS